MFTKNGICITILYIIGYLAAIFLIAWLIEALKDGAKV